MMFMIPGFTSRCKRTKSAKTVERLIKGTIHPKTTDHVNFTFLLIALILRQFLIISVEIDQSVFLSRLADSAGLQSAGRV